MGKNEKLDLAASGGVESAAHVVVQDNNEDGDNCDRGVSNEHADNKERNADTRSMSTVELDKDLSDALSKMVLRVCSICANFFKVQSKINTKFREPSILRGRGAKVYHSSLLSLEESVDGGCPLCQELSKGLEKLFQESPEVKTTMDQSSSIWCHLESQSRSWSSDDQRGVMMSFHLYRQDSQHLGDDSCPDTCVFIKSLLFYAAGSLSIGPEFRGKKKISSLAVVT